MSGSKTKLQPQKKRLIAAFKAEFHRCATELKDHPDYKILSREDRGRITAQNALRVCLEAAFEQMLPFGEVTPIDMAIRLASYCLSVLPVDRQVYGLTDVLKTLPDAHQHRMEAGVRIRSTWDMSAVRRPGLKEDPQTPKRRSRHDLRGGVAQVPPSAKAKRPDGGTEQ